MSIYGEGEYAVSDTRLGCAGPPPGDPADGAGVGVHVPELRPRAHSPRHAGDKASRADLRLRRHEARPRGALSRCRSGIRHPDRRPRFFNVYGPGQALSNPYTGVAAIFASRLLNGRPPVIFEDGKQSRDFIHVSDIAEGILLALESDVSDVPSISAPDGP